ncbi:MAG: class I SAM-dependent methyltransferase [Gammaproteobacteria bacterium]|nr:MAG: class I SAM-dependent methyltransferase [Gammaproteobacteria bacterium]
MSEHDDTLSNYASNVRAQYEAYPFPLRDPRDESKRLVIAEQDCLGKLNHYCFGGRQSFGNGFRVLVAGGGTGDHTIFLAEQLREYDASVTYIDISSSSLGICKERGRTRALDNIEWHQCSLLDVASLDVAPFDLISCTGVLHHLPEPERGLEALRAVLAPDGAMSLMLYGRTGRMAVYAGQELTRLVNDGIDDPKLKTQHARALVQCLPETNWLLRGGDRKKILTELLDDESNLNDVLLHDQDRAYSVPEIYEFLAEAQLELIEFTSFYAEPPCCRFMYDPTAWITDPALKAHVAKLPRPQQQAIAEAMNCVLTCHGFYAAPEAAERVALPNDFDMVPFFHYFDPGNLPQHFRDAAGRECGLSYRQSTIQFEVGKYSADLVAGIDGSRSMGELMEMVRRKSAVAATQSELLQHFMAFYEPLNTLDVLLLRHRSVAPFRECAREVTK